MEILNFYIPEWFFVALNLIILIVLLRVFLWKPVNKIITARQEKIALALENAEKAEAEMLGMASRRAEFTAELEQNTVDQMKDARVRAGREFDRIVTEAEAKANSIIFAAITQADREREGIMRSAKAEIVAAAFEATSVLLEQSIDSEQNERLIEKFLKQRGVG